MGKIIDMQAIRHLNLFIKISGVATKHFFNYNNTLVFGVPKALVSKAIGKNAVNVKKLNQILRRKIKVVAMPIIGNNASIEKFITDLVNPIEIGKIDITEDKIEINATRMSKASLIGRNRAREKELFDILKSTLNVENIQFV